MNEQTIPMLSVSFMSSPEWLTFLETRLPELDGEHLCISSEPESYTYESNGVEKIGMEKKLLFTVKNGKVIRYVANMSVGHCLDSNIYHNGFLKNIYFVGFSYDQHRLIQKVVCGVNEGGDPRKFGDAITSLLAD